MPKYHHVLYTAVDKKPVYKITEKNFSLSLRNLTVKKKTFDGVLIQGKTVEHVDLFQANFEKARICGSTFNGVRLNQVKFNGATLENVDFLYCDLFDVDFLDADLTRVIFAQCRGLPTVNFKGATIGFPLTKYKVDRLIYHGVRFDGYEFFAFLSQDKKVVIKAGCHFFTYKEYVEHYIETLEEVKRNSKLAGYEAYDEYKEAWLEVFYRKQMLNTIAEFATALGIKLSQIRDDLIKFRPKSVTE